MFLGTYEPRLDDKGRLILPARFREQLSEGLVITQGQDRCLYIYTEKEFEERLNAIVNSGAGGRQVRDFVRMFTANASDMVPDKQGRITINSKLREYAGLDRDVAVIGAATRVEVWDKESWERYSAANVESYSQTAEEVIPGVF